MPPVTVTSPEQLRRLHRRVPVSHGGQSVCRHRDRRQAAPRHTVPDAAVGACREGRQRAPSRSRPPASQACPPAPLLPGPPTRHWHRSQHRRSSQQRAAAKLLTSTPRPDLSSPPSTYARTKASPPIDLNFPPRRQGAKEPVPAIWNRRVAGGLLETDSTCCSPRTAVANRRHGVAGRVIPSRLNPRVPRLVGSTSVQPTHSP